MAQLLLGLDVGSSSIKASLLDAQSGTVLASATSPDKELDILAPQLGWAEQHPDTWWQHIVAAIGKIKSSFNFDAGDVKAIGISYQMHGLVCVDKNGGVLRPSIIWCDSRAAEIGKQAAAKIGEQNCLNNLLNLPGNFTASKLKWVKDNQPDIYQQIDKIVLPGDYIAYRMTGEIKTTPSGLSEGIMWDFLKNDSADLILDYYGIDKSLLADVVPTFSVQGELTEAAAKELGLKAAIPVSYRGGDQPNNALSLNVLHPGEIAATAGTSGVVYGVTDKANYDPKSRVNTFVHVNYTKNEPSYGVLLCVNGTGILNSWLKHNLAAGDETASYEQMNELASQVPVGSEGLVILPFGNGAERTLENRNIGASVHNWNFNMHKKAHLLRATQEGIVFALNYGLSIMRDMAIDISIVRAGHANMFLSPLFAEAFATLTGATIELYNTDGSVGAARGAGYGAGIYNDLSAAFVGLEPVKTIEPTESLKTQYNNAYNHWLEQLKKQLT